MSLHDRIAKRLLVRGLPGKKASGWFTNLQSQMQEADRQVLESASTRVVFGDKLAALKCEVAGDEQSQTVGLQKYASLPGGYGMIFPYDEPRKVAFHMGTVAFPIDIIFVGSDGRVNKIVPDIEPGQRGSWAMSHVAAVIEANGGFCRDNGIEVGCEVITGLEKEAQIEFTPDPRKDINPKMVPANPMHDRFKDHGLPDDVTDGQPMDGAHFEQSIGRDPASEMLNGPGATRPAAKKSSK